MPEIFPYQDIAGHIVEYFLFALLIKRALKVYTSGDISSRLFLRLFIYAFIYALSDEWHQCFVAGRVCSVIDLTYDSIGIVLANSIYR